VRWCGRSHPASHTSLTQSLELPLISIGYDTAPLPLQYIEAGITARTEDIQSSAYSSLRGTKVHKSPFYKDFLRPRSRSDRQVDDSSGTI